MKSVGISHGIHDQQLLSQRRLYPPEVEEEDPFVDLDAETASQDDPMH